MLYNYTSFGNFLDFFTFFNTVTNDIFWTLTVLAIFIIIVLILSRFEIENTILSSAFVTSVYAILLKIGGLVGNGIVTIFIIITALVGAFKFFYSKR